jgi:hypothetical protein
VNFNQAKKLKPGDKLVCKNSGQAVTVSSIEVDKDWPHWGPAVWIKGVGSKQGAGSWIHRAVKKP